MGTPAFFPRFALRLLRRRAKAALYQGALNMSVLVLLCFESPRSGYTERCVKMTVTIVTIVTNGVPTLLGELSFLIFGD